MKLRGAIARRRSQQAEPPREVIWLTTVQRPEGWGSRESRGHDVLKRAACDDTTVVVVPPSRLGEDKQFRLYHGCIIRRLVHLRKKKKKKKEDPLGCAFHAAGLTMHDRRCLLSQSL